MEDGFGQGRDEETKTTRMQKKKKNTDDSLPEANEARSCKVPTKKIRVTEEKEADRAKTNVKKEREKKNG